MAIDKIHEPFAMINADDFYGQDAYKSLAAYYSGWTPDRRNDFCMVGYDIVNCLSENGTVSRGVCISDAEGKLVEVIERTKISKSGDEIVFLDDREQPVTIPAGTLVSMNFWGFTPSLFEGLKAGFREFILKNAQDPKAEFFIPSVLNDMINTGKAAVTVLSCQAKWFGMTYREDRPEVMAGIRELIGKGEYPENLWK